MSFWLETPSLPYPPISLVEIERLKYHNTAISASWVRKLLAQGDSETIRKLVPPATCHYLQRLLTQRAQKAASTEKGSALAKSSAPF